MAQKKEADGVRPIAIGETLRRSVGKCWVQSEKVCDAYQRLLEPRKLGVGTRGGAEAIVRTICAIIGEYGHDPELALLKIDFKNAFNVVLRDLFL